MSATLTKDGSALIVVDMQNAYLHPEGSFARLWPDAARKNPARLTGLDQTDDPVETGRHFDLTLLRGAIPGCKRLIDGAHEAGVPVIYLTYVYRADYADGGVLIQDINPSLKGVRYVVDGSWDAAIIDELTPRENDFIIKKSRYSGFHSTRLETVLRSLRAEKLVICGVTTHFCVECTARDAHMRDYRVWIPSDGTDEVNPVWKDTALTAFAYGFGWVNTVDDVLSAWRLSAAA